MIVLTCVNIRLDNIMLVMVCVYFEFLKDVICQSVIYLFLSFFFSYIYIYAYVYIYIHTRAYTRIYITFDSLSNSISPLSFLRVPRREGNVLVPRARRIDVYRL